jgi:hypothetical protein
MGKGELVAQTCKRQLKMAPKIATFKASDV